jgi:uncharacterized membrane protein YgcG
VTSRALRILGAAVLLLALAAPAGRAAETPDRIPDQAVYDYAEVLDDGTETGAEQVSSFLEDFAAADVIVVTEVGAGITAEQARGRAAALSTALGVGEDSRGGGLLLLLVVDAEGCHGRIEMAADEAFDGVVDGTGRDAIVDEAIVPLQACNADAAVLTSLGRLLTAVTAAGPPPIGGSGGVSAGPPFPDPVTDVAVYDHAGVFDPATIASAESTIDAIENRTGAEIVVYTQVVGFGGSEEQTRANARALMDQWGVGRLGFDDGLVILFDLDDTLLHGQVQLFAGPGYEAAYLSNAERQAIFENDMLPRLRAEDLDGALLIALQRIDVNATPEHAATLARARQLDAAVGLIGAPIAFLGIAGWAMWSWWRFGRDPVYLDDPSIHIPAPPPELTAASATLVLEGRSSRRSLTTALLDLASRGLLRFREESSLLGLRKKVGIETQPPAGDEMTEAQRARNARRPTSSAEQYVLTRLRAIGDDGESGYIEPGDLLKFGASVETFNNRLEAHVVSKGWFKEQPRKVTQRWGLRGGIAMALGGAGIWAGFQLPSNGLLLVGVALLLAGVAMLLMARSMPAVTMPGAMIRAMLAAYRRTLDKTMAQARSMQQVVDEAHLDWLDTPDQAVVWGLALGLQERVEAVLERSMEDIRDGVATGATYLPAWYSSGSGGSSTSLGGGGGLFSSGSLPNFGGMMGALGTIGNSPSSSGSGGGFGGGGSGGGGGGAGGGF